MYVFIYPDEKLISNYHNSFHTNYKMNLCMTLSSLLAMVILLRILFTIKEFGNDDAYSLEPMTKKQLRGFQANIIAYQKFKDIHKNPDIFYRL